MVNKLEQKVRTLQLIASRKQKEFPLIVDALAEARRSLNQDYISAIQQAISAGAKTRKEISEQTHINYSRVLKIINEEEIPFTKLRKNRTPEEIDYVTEIIDSNSSSSEDFIQKIEKIINLSQENFPFGISEFNYGCFTRAEYIKIYKSALVKKAIWNGARTRKEISDMSKVQYRIVSKIIKDEGLIPLKECNLKSMAVLDDLILDGLILSEMREKTGFYIDKIHDYISSNGFHEIHKEAKKLRKKEKPKSKKAIQLLEMINNSDKYFSTMDVANELHKTPQAVSSMLRTYGLEKAFVQKRKSLDNKLKKENPEKGQILIPFFQQYLEKRIKELSWSEQKAFEYIQSINCNFPHHSFETLTYLFERYKETKDSGEKITFREIGKIIGIHSTGVRRVLKSFGESSLYWEQKYRPRMSESEKSAVQRGLETAISKNDLAYFLDRPGIAFEKKIKKTKRIGTREHSSSYFQISQIYEAQDLGFSEDEISYLLDKNILAVNLAINRRPEIENDLIPALRKIYDDDSIEKPYVNVAERVKELRRK